MAAVHIFLLLFPSFCARSWRDQQVAVSHALPSSLMSPLCFHSHWKHQANIIQVLAPQSPTPLTGGGGWDSRPWGRLCVYLVFLVFLSFFLFPEDSCL